MSFPIRSFISRAAFTVKVAIMMFHGCSLSCFSNHAVREVKVCVLPLPGPAKIAKVCAEEETAAFCEEFRFASIASDAMSRRRVQSLLTFELRQERGNTCTPYCHLQISIADARR